MKKVLLFAMVFGLLSVAHAKDEVNSFIGFEYGKADLSLDSGYDEDSDLYGVRLGASQGMYRAYLSASKYDKEKNISALHYQLAIDRYLVKTTNLPVTIAPYIGFNLGYLDVEDDRGGDATGAAYGAQAGVVLNPDGIVGLDLYYKYTAADNSQVDDLSAIMAAIQIQFQ